MFQNVGDGTYFHSGLLAIRAAVASRVNITFKILYNDAVAMTGGQAMDGPLDVPRISRQVQAEGVKRVVVVSDEPKRYADRQGLASGVGVFPRESLDTVQRQLRELSGTTVLIYDQTCAAEKRRRRKRGQYPDPPRRVFINSAVCEGCGDCGVASNCLAVVPLETQLGRKRAIDQSACNKDYSCVNGFCPSFVTVHGGRLRRGQGIAGRDQSAVPIAEPQLPALHRPYGIVITGIGGTGVITIGALIGMAAHIDGRGCSILDQMGLAQKGGAVVSHLKIAISPAEINATRIAAGGADLVLGGDLLVTGSPPTLATMAADRTRVVANAQANMTGDFTRNPDLEFPGASIEKRIRNAVGTQHTDFINATRLATALLGDAIAANLFLLGYIFQRGLLPVSSQALIAAIELNGVAVEMNLQAFAWGRRAALDSKAVADLAFAQSNPEEPIDTSLEGLIRYRERYLQEYQDVAYARGYREVVDRVRAAEKRYCPGHDEFSRSVAENYFKLLAYKDEYEVARLYTQADYQRALNQQFEGDYHLEFHLAPPLWSTLNRTSGRPGKRRFGPWMLKVFAFLAPYKTLRGTWRDPFGYSRERRMERQLIRDYEDLVEQILKSLNEQNHALAVALASVPEQIRGFGPVKAQAVAKAKQHEKRLLAQYTQLPTRSIAA